MFRTHRWIRVLPVTGCCAIGGGWIWTRPPGCAHAISRKRTRPAAPKTPHNRVRSTEQIKPPHARGPSPSSGPQDHHSTARVRLVTDKRHMASRATDPTCGISTPQRGLDSNAPAPPSERIRGMVLFLHSPMTAGTDGSSSACTVSRIPLPFNALSRIRF